MGGQLIQVIQQYPPTPTGCNFIISQRVLKWQLLFKIQDNIQHEITGVTMHYGEQEIHLVLFFK